MLQLEIIGNLGADAEVKAINGREYISMRIASTTKFKDKSETTWVSVLYRRTDALLPYLTKGTSVYVCGELNASAWVNRDGKASADLRVWAANLCLLGKHTTDGEKTQQAQNNGEITDNNEDIPF